MSKVIPPSPRTTRSEGTMHRTTTITALTLAATACLALTACQPTDGGAKAEPKPATTTAADGTATGTSGGATEPAQAASPRKAQLPDLVGKGLQSAQDSAQAAGFYSLRSHDALGRGRMQVMDRHWKVCTQSPGPGTVDTTATIDFGTVKLEESCPSDDAGADKPTRASATMPDLRGKSMKVARQSLETNTGITVKDASGQSRLVIVESNWKVCTQDPAAGAKLDGRPVSFGVVKFEESCG
ncbi:PASTA domain-containing protein [Streptomyces sp. NPDC003077]|uniref:PASTA domain-containing protein n=1 Tax=Streptomyces sp. NPDC003077 TaxID=3154443 RepID=UPI0033B0AF10